MVTRLINIEVVRFGISGATSTGIYVVVLAVAVGSLPVFAASILAYAAAMVANYLMQRIWTFRSQRRHREAVPRYLLTHLGGMALNAVILFVFYEKLGLDLVLTQLASFVVIATWSFLCQKVWVFARR